MSSLDASTTRLQTPVKSRCRTKFNFFANCASAGVAMSKNESPTISRHRAIRSFVIRAGRMTPGQRRALNELWPQWGLDFSPRPTDPSVWFGDTHPVTLEIGFGMGDSLVELATLAPERNFIGIEVHEPGVGRLLMNAREAELTNLRVSRHDAVEVLKHQIIDNSIDRILIFFPDPWHKKRHHKRRLVQAELVELLARKLRPGGRLHLATDWENYAEQMLEVVGASPWFENLDPGGRYSPRPDDRPVTKFERRGQRLGHGTWDLLFRRRQAPENSTLT
jgi:tRNA (guanine-N7-)-methyltransferase